MDIASIYDKKVGDYVVLIDDTYLVNVGNNVLGKAASKNVGKIVAVENYCVKVEFGSQGNIGIYDPVSLAYVYVKLAPNSKQTGVLGAAGSGKLGSIVNWSDFGKGDTVEVSSGGKKSSYSVNEVLFITALIRMPPQFSGGKRVTLRKGKNLKQYYTRILKRV